MRFRSHLAVGAVAGALFGTTAILTGSARTIEEGALLLALCAGAALLPDLDVASVPQRWFYRAAGVGLALLLAAGRPWLAAIAGLAALLPLLHHHRGWTHRWWAAIVAPLALVALWTMLAIGEPTGAPSDLAALARATSDRVVSHLPICLALVTGYAAHLVADGLRPRRGRAR